MEYYDFSLLTVDPILVVKQEVAEGGNEPFQPSLELGSSVGKSPLIQTTSIPESRSPSPELEMHLSQAHISSVYEPQDFMSPGGPISDPTQYPLVVPPVPPVTPTHTYFPPPPHQSDPYYSTYSRQYESNEMNKQVGFQPSYSSIYQASQYTAMDPSNQKLVVNPHDVCFDQSGYRQMLGTMMNHLVPSGSQICQAAKESLRQRVPSMASASRSSGSSRTKITNDVTAMKEKTPCDICGDVSAGFHCNAYVCEACKKFFIRSSKNESYTKYSCSKVNACEVNKDTRTHCQRCRFYKCLRIGMVLPGAAVCPANDISIIPCRVCGAQSSGFHFGAITCEGCKGFFRRTISERDNQRYTCRNGGTCLVTLATRNNCKSCRYRKCLSVGMSKDGSRIGRQPNAVKHMCAIEIERIKLKINSSTAQTTPPSSGSSNPSNSTIYRQFDNHHHHHHQHNNHHHHQQQQGQLHLLHQTNNLLYQPTKIEEGGATPELLFPPWPPANYPSYYESSDQSCLPEINKISTGLEQQRFAKLAELAGEGQMSSQYSSTAAAAATVAMDSYDNRYGNVAPDSDTSSLQGPRHNHAISDNPLLTTMQTATASSLATTILPTIKPQLYNSSTTSVTMNSYEQAALSSLIRLAKQVQSVNNSSSDSTSGSGNNEVILAGRPTQVNLLKENFPPIGSLQPLQHIPSGSLQPIEEGEDVDKRAIISGEVEMGGVVSVTGEEGSSPEDERGKLLNRSLGHPSVDALMVGKSNTSNVPPITQSFALNEDRFTTDDYQTINTLYSNRKSNVDGTRSHNATPMRTSMPSQASISFTAQMSLEAFSDFVSEAGVHLDNCRQRITDNFLLETEVTAATMWAHMMAQFEAHAHQVISFARAIPGFCDLPRADTKFLVQASMYPIVLVQLSRESLPGADFNFFNFSPRERRHLLTEFPQLNPVADHFYELTSFLGPLNLDNTEAALLCSIIFLRGSNQRLLEAEKIYEIYNHAASALQQYIAVRYSSDERFTHLIKLLPSLSSMNETHRAAMRDLRQSRPDLHFPDLFIQILQLDGNRQSGGIARSIDTADSGLVNSSG